MAIKYVKSGASGLANGSSWVNAYTTLAAAATAAAAGDTIYVSHAHSESSAANITITSAGTATAPVKIICANDSVEPPTAVATTASVVTTGGTVVAINGYLYCYGVKFSGGTGANNGGLSLCGQSGNGMQVYERCELKIGVTPTSGQSLGIGTGGSTGSRGVNLKNTNVVLSGTGNRIVLQMCNLTWDGGAVTGTTPSTGLIFVNGSGSGYTGAAKISGVDFSGLSSALILFSWSNQGVDAWVRNCKLPASWAGSLVAGTKSPIASTFAMHDSDSADTNYRLWVEDYAGVVKSETALIKTGGASDGTTGIALKVDSNANTNLVAPLIFALPAVWNDVVGSAVTLTVDILHDSTTNLTDADVWVGAEYLGTTGFPLSSFVYDSQASVLAAAADQTASSATWTTTGMTNPNKQKLEVTFTPQKKGYILPRLYVPKTGPYTIYVDLKPQVS